MFRNTVSNTGSPVKSGVPCAGRLMPRTKQRTPELRDKVLAAAVDLLAEEGAAGLTARSLAARAETSAPALYELFGDKSGVVRELYFEGFRRLFSELSALAETEDPVADLWALADRVPAVPPGQPGAGRGHVLPTVHRLLARGGGARGDRLGADPHRRPGASLHRGGAPARRRDGRRARVRRAGPGDGVRRGGRPARDLDRVGGAALAPRRRHPAQRFRGPARARAAPAAASP